MLVKLLDYISMLYLDHAAATPLDGDVLASMQPYLTDKYFNASASYMAAKAIARDIAVARTDVAKVLGVRPAEIIFTAGGTEANNLAIHGVMKSYPDAEVVVSALEHESVLRPAERYTHTVVGASPKGIVTSEQVIASITDKTVLVSVMYANNEIGTIQPIREIAQAIVEIRRERIKQHNELPLYLHTDAAQAGNYLHLIADTLGIDMMTVNSGKLYGPKQTGALYVKAGIRLEPLILGGGQEQGLRSGTENVANVIGFAHALTKAQQMRIEESKRLQAIRQQIIATLKQVLPEVTVTIPHKRVLPNNLHITVPGYDNERLVMSLDEQGILCAVGSACSASNDEPSHVLKAIGFSDEEAQASIRFTMGRSTSQDDMYHLVAVLRKLIV